MPRTYASLYVHKFYYGYYETISYVDYVRDELTENYHGFLDQNDGLSWELGFKLKRLKRELDSKWLNSTLGGYPWSLMSSPLPACKVNK